jgi:hypothetical protein
MKSLKSSLLVVLMTIMMAIASVVSAQYYHEEKLDRFLDGHPKVKAELAQNPDLLYNKQWREKHPGLEQFMQNHPNVWGKLPNSGRYGAYGPDHQWHEADQSNAHSPATYQNLPQEGQEHLNSGTNNKQNAEWSKHREHEETKELKHQQRKEANAGAKAEHSQKHQGHSHD